jgi:hypothetical protein
MKVKITGTLRSKVVHLRNAIRKVFRKASK